MTKDEQTGQGGFTLIEVSIASLIVLVGLVALAGLFTLSISQNKIVKQYTSTTAFAQEKIEQLTALEQGDARLVVGGSLTAPATVGGIVYSDDIYVSDNASDSDIGTVYMTSSGPAIPGGVVNAQYRRYWSVQLVPTPSLPTPTLANSVLIGVRVVALQAGRSTGKAEETTLTIVRSW